MVFSCAHLLFDCSRASEASQLRLTSAAKLTRRSQYYVESLFIAVESTIFNVPHHLFEPECKSLQLLSPRPREQDGAGWVEERPIVLPGLNRGEFAAFPRYHCKQWMGCTPNLPKPALKKSNPRARVKFSSLAGSSVTTISFWEPVLNVAVALQFEYLRERAIRELTQSFAGGADVVKQIQLARKYNNRDWLISGFTALVKKDTTIDDEDVKVLGMGTTIRLLRLRDRVFPKSESLRKAILAEVDMDIRANSNGVDNTQRFVNCVDDPQSPSSSPLKWYHKKCCFTYVIFKVNDLLFRFPTHFLTTQSEVFQDLLNLPKTEVTEGETEDNPIVLENISPFEFKAFIHTIWPDAKRAHSLEYWISVLKLSTMWLCKGLRDNALLQLSSLVAQEGLEMKKLTLGRQYNIQGWEIQVYHDLANRRTPITAEERKVLGPQVVLGLLELRDVAVRIDPEERSESQYDGLYRLKDVTLAEIKRKFFGTGNP